MGDGVSSNGSSNSSNHDVDVGRGSNTQPKKRKRTCGGKRGVVTMKKVTEARKNGKKIEIAFDRDCQPIGPNKSTFSGYVCYLARTEIPLTENNWRTTDIRIKQKIYEEVELCFTPIDLSRYDMIMKKVGKAARDFRTKLAKKCYDDEGLPILKPPKNYAKFNVVRQSWLDFVDKVGGKRFKGDELDMMPPVRRRFLLSKFARTRKDGSIDDDVQMIVDEEESIAETFTSKELLCRGPNDVFTRALKKEFHGRMLTAGHGVIKRYYFNNSRDSSVDARVNQLEELLFNMRSRMEVMNAKLDELSQVRASDKEFKGIPSHHVSPIVESSQASCPILIPDLIPEGGSACDLYMDPPLVKIGSGLVFRGKIMHNIVLNAEQVKVCLTEIVEGYKDTPLPFRNVQGEITLVKHALRTFVAWPIKLVSLQRKVSKLDVINKESVAQSVAQVSRRKPTYPQEGDQDPYCCFLICKAHASNLARNESFAISMPGSLWGEAFEDQISFKNVREIVSRDSLGASTICLYIRYLCDLHLDDAEGGQVSSRFYFISPHRMLDHSHLVDMLQKHEGQDHLLMIPYNTGNHWVLVAINTKTEWIHYMDPLQVHHSHRDRADLMHKINNAMSSYRDTRKQIVSSRKKLGQHNWASVECPRQLASKAYCGFYICLFMEDILESGTTSLSLAYPQKRRCDMFTEDRIIHVQHGWCGYLYNKFMKNVGL